MATSVSASVQPQAARVGPDRRPSFPWLPLLVLCGVALLLAGLVGEIVVRVADLRWTQVTHPECLGAQAILNGQKGLFRIDSEAGYVMRPNACVLLRSQEYDQVLLTNSHGFVGPDLPTAAKPAGEFRVVVLGDSYTVAGQVPYQLDYTTVLEQRLHDAGFARVRVVNAGVGGYTTFNEAGLLRSNLAWLQPDLVVVAAFLGNDVAENVLATYGGYRDAPEHPDGVTWSRAAVDLLTESDDWFPRNPPRPAGAQPGAPSPLSRARSTASGAWDQARAASRLLGTLFGDPIHAAGVTTAPGGVPPAREQRRLSVASFEWTILRDVPPEEHLNAAWPLFGHYLSDIRDTAASVAAPTAIVAIPEMAQFDDQMRARVMGDYRFLEDEVDWDQPQRLLKARAAQAGIPMLDLLPVFRSRPDRADLYLRLDTHFTALGHAATAEALAQFLESILPR